MAYVEGTTHGQGFARLFKPEMFEAWDIVHQTGEYGNLGSG